MKTCFLFGHRDSPYDIQGKIVNAVRRHYEEFDIRHFVVGGYGSFDAMAGSAVKNVKQIYGDICLSLLIPYHPADRSIVAPPGFDGSFYPDGMETVPRRVAIVRANQYMIRHADTIICYVAHFGNTRTLLEQAQRRADLYIENIL